VPLPRGHDLRGHVVQEIRGQVDVGVRAQTTGAVKPPIDCATSTTSRRPPIASVTASAYSGSPADSSAPGRSTATASWPRACSSGTTRCQYQAAPPAPGTSTNTLIHSSLSPVPTYMTDQSAQDNRPARLTGEIGRSPDTLSQ
jgi:hypothetical protein